MKIESLVLPGVLLVHLDVKNDARGFFVETWKESWGGFYGDYAAYLAPEFVQMNHSWSIKGTLRGLHYQPGMGKYVHVISGKVLDVAFDLLTGEYAGALLDNSLAMYIPPGMAHGFLALTDANVTYSCTAGYNPQTEGGIHWKSCKRFWPIEPEIVSEKDRNLPTWAVWRSLEKNRDILEAL